MCSVDKKLGPSFVKNMKSIINSLAEVAQEGDQIMFSRSRQAAPSRVVSAITLLYHHFILQATRPLPMCLIKTFLEPAPLGIDRDMISQPMSSLLKTSVASALTTLKILCSLEKQRLLGTSMWNKEYFCIPSNIDGATESFLPFDLEYAFSSALLVCLMQAVIPEYVTDKTWRALADSLLVTMMGQGSVVAGLRRSELCYLEQLLAPVLPCDNTAGIIPEEDEGALGLIDAASHSTPPGPGVSGG